MQQVWSAHMTMVGLALWGLMLGGAGPVAAQEHLILLGETNWAKPWVPDFRRSDRPIFIPLSNRLDVLILGDGYLAEERQEFEQHLQDWYRRFLSLTPWGQFRGAFRLRGLWLPSTARATADRRSRFQVGVSEGKVSDTASSGTSAALYGALAAVDLNRTSRGKLLTHSVAVMLIKDERGQNPSGRASTVASPDGKSRVAVAFGADSHHEFGHAYGGLRDEYIGTAGTTAKGRPPERRSLVSISNLSYTRELARLPWSHLAPGSAVNPDSASLIGVMWLGGIEEHGVWHSEARCLMNGRHDNWDLAKTRRGQGLRDLKRFCFWCEEILVAKTCQRAGQLGDVAEEQLLWTRWCELRPSYHQSFQVPARIQAQNAANARARLADAKLYERPR